MRRINLLVVVGISFFVWVACKAKLESHKEAAEDFEEFHVKFYSDSVFQLSRIIFPLKGSDSDVIYGNQQVEDQENDVYSVKGNQLYWNRKGWRYIKAPVKNDEFVVTFEKKEDSTTVTERIQSKVTELVITYKYSLVDNRWMLSYYGSAWY